MVSTLQIVPANTSVSPVRMRKWCLGFPTCCQYGRSFHAPDETYNTAWRAARTPDQGAASGRGPGDGRQCSARIGVDALDHGTKTVRTLRCKMFAQPHFFEQRNGVGRDNVLG